MSTHIRFYMDSNVSKKTFLHKFFKLRLPDENASLSIKELLQHKLRSILDLWHQNYNIFIDSQFLANAIGSKIVLIYPTIESISSNRHKDQVSLAAQLNPIIYSSSIAFLLASANQKMPQTIAEELVDLLASQANDFNASNDFNFNIEVSKSGMINFYLEDGSLGVWLTKSLVLLTKKTDINSSNLLIDQSSNQNAHNLFPAQYIHARCFNLLDLGRREKLITLNKNFQSISWLDQRNNLLCQEEIEFMLIRQLCLVTDSFEQTSVNWSKLALNLSEIVAIFLAECSCFGKVKHQMYPVAIARLGLIALTQYWLQRILEEKLQIAAPTSL